MRNRTTLLIVAIIVVGLLAIGSTVGAMALAHSGFMWNGFGNGMMNRQRVNQGMMDRTILPWHRIKSHTHSRFHSSI